MTLSEDKDVAKEEVEEEETSIYDEATPNRIIVGRNFPLSFYVDRARRILRIEAEVHIDGRGENIATACKLVESLKRQKVAQTEKISTGMNTEPYFTAQGDAHGVHHPLSYHLNYHAVNLLNLSPIIN